VNNKFLSETFVYHFFKGQQYSNPTSKCQQY